MSNSPRVLVVETQSAPGGMWHYACALSRGLADVGCEVALATTVPFEPLDDIKKIRVISIGPKPEPKPFSPWHWSHRAIAQAQRFRRLHEVIRELRPDIVHVHNTVGKLDFLYFRYLRSLGVSVVYTAHDPRPDTGLSWFDWARYRAADVILVHSTNGREDLKAGGIHESRIVRIHHGNYLHLCPSSSLSSKEARSLLGVRPDARIILFFGTILPYKGLDILVEAYAALRGSDDNAHLVIAGEPLEDFAPYRHRIDTHGLGDRVALDLRYIPFSEFPKYFRAADAVVFPYRHIYQSGVLQLAYAYERPVVVTNVGGLGETVAEDHTGFVVPTEDPDALASAIRRMLSDPAAAEEMGRRGRRLAETKYAWTTIAGQVREVYRSVNTELLNGSRGPQ